MQRSRKAVELQMLSSLQHLKGICYGFLRSWIVIKVLVLKGILAEAYVTYLWESIETMQL